MFKILDSCLFATIQDLGRRGWQRFGVPVSGAMDAFALAAGNRLVGNPAGAAAIETTLGGLVLEAVDDCLAAVTGCGYRLWVDERQQPAWTTLRLGSGSILRLEPLPPGGWGYLAIAGGFEVPLVMGSRATYLRGKFGGIEGRSLLTGDLLRAGEKPANWRSPEGCCLPASRRPAYAAEPVLRLLLADDLSPFTSDGVQTFLSSIYRVGVNSDRMGCRLEGAPVKLVEAADILSEGLAVGMVQVPADGQPIVMLCDSQTTGGYVRIGAVIRADLPLLVQCPLEVGAVRFRVVTLVEAQQTYRQQQQDLDEGVVELEDDELLWASA